MGGLPTPCSQPPSHLPHRFEWAGWAHYNLSARATGQWHKPYHRWSLSTWGLISCHLQWRNLDQKILPLGEVSTIMVASLHKSPPKSEGSMTMEVRNLLSQAVLETSSCGSEHSSSRRPTPVAVPMTPPQKPEGPPSASRHLILGKCWGSGSLSSGHPC